MVKCNGCGNENTDEAVFCAVCGSQLGKNCPRCLKPTKFGSKFCSSCGMPLDGSKICKGCKTVVPKDAKTCPKCGLREDGLIVCAKCGNTVEKDDRFCKECGSAARNAYAVRSAQNVNVSKIVGLARGWTMTLIMGIMFILSFFSMFQISVPMQQYNLKTNVNSTDIIGGVFLMIDPPSADQALKDFNKYVQENNNLKSDADTDDMLKESQRLLEKYGPLKLVVTKEAMENGPAIILTLLAWFVAALGIIGVTLAFFICCLINSLQYTLGAKDTLFKHYNIGLALTLALPLVFIPLTGFAIAGCAAAICIISAAGLAVNISVHYATVKKVSVKSVITQSVAAVLAVALMFCFVGKAVGIRAGAPDTSDSSLNFKSSISQIDLITGDIDTSELEASIKKEYPSFYEALVMTDASGMSPIFLSAALSPAMLFGFDETVAFRPGGIAIGYMSFFALLAAAAFAVLTIVSSLNAIATGKRKISLKGVIGLAVSLIAVLTFNIINVAMCASIVKQLALPLKYTMGAVGIVTSALGLTACVGSIIMRILVKPEVSLPEPV